MTVREFADKGIFELVNMGEFPDAEITKCFCCDLLSVAMGKAPAGGCWVTVMANANTLAVASLTETACVVLAEGMRMDDMCIHKAASQGITVFCTKAPVFDAAYEVHRLLNG